MNYTNCAYEFTPGQAERAYAITQSYHPGLLENNFHFPNLDFVGLTILDDSDDDQILNPGETSNFSIGIENSWGASANDLSLIHI